VALIGYAAYSGSGVVIDFFGRKKELREIKTRAGTLSEHLALYFNHPVGGVQPPKKSRDPYSLAFAAKSIERMIRELLDKAKGSIDRLKDLLRDAGCRRPVILSP
jgi:hypothetical protein